MGTDLTVRINVIMGQVRVEVREHKSAVGTESFVLWFSSDDFEPELFGDDLVDEALVAGFAEWRSRHAGV